MRWVFLQLFRIFDMNKTITTLLTAAGIAASAPASAVIVGGIDFGALGADPTRTHLETATLAQTFITGTGKTRPPTVSLPPLTATIPIALTEAAIAGYIMSRTLTIHKTFPGERRFRRIHQARRSQSFSPSRAAEICWPELADQSTTIQALNGGNPWVTLHGHNNLGR